VKELKLSDIRIDGGTQPRKELDQEMVKDYAEKMRDQVVFPPIVVFHDGSDHWLVDGFHRYFAQKSNGLVSVQVEIHNGTLRDAKLYSFGANGKHGKPPSQEDKRNNIIEMLTDKEWGKWSNAQIAKIVHVASPTVARVRVLLEESKKIDKPEKKTYVDKHGNQTTMDTSNLGKKSKPQEEPNEEDDKDQKIAELSDTINAMAEEITIYRDKAALGQWNASEIEKIDIEETVANLREQIRILEIDNKALRESRDMFQNRNAELIKTINAMKRKDKR
jgi:ParB-like nuclease domain